ncbi:hypothetical protein LAZ67_18001582 [Cordylochernes scorpioides]|uniref:Uncharacterized protein n=1 Tax=Cordylochernes scorpioides TaxID=51811 RepID=A0ABY6LFW6_9ARAC|nr:hypothetical protein LAZ67_18001582 [Cordylochernes scorpioides]
MYGVAGVHGLRGPAGMDPERHPSPERPVPQALRPLLVQQGDRGLQPHPRPTDLRGRRHDRDWREDIDKYDQYWVLRHQYVIPGSEPEWRTEAASQPGPGRLPEQRHLPPGRSPERCRRPRGSTHLPARHRPQGYPQAQGDIYPVGPCECVITVVLGVRPVCW